MSGRTAGGAGESLRVLAAAAEGCAGAASPSAAMRPPRGPRSSALGERLREPLTSVVRVLDLDPELGDGLGGERLALAQRSVRALRLALRNGLWEQPVWSQAVRSGIGLLLLDGLMIRRVQLGGRYAAELLGPGDLLRPWQEDDDVASVSRSSGWRCLRAGSVALLDLDFARRIAPYPEIQGQLMARSLRRSRHLAITIAILNQPKIDRRLLMLLWHMADRWGVMRRGDALLPTHIPHAVLAELLAARRPTVTTALGALQQSGRIIHCEEGWILHAPPPGEPFHLDAHAQPTASFSSRSTPGTQRERSSA